MLDAEKCMNSKHLSCCYLCKPQSVYVCACVVFCCVALVVNLAYLLSHTFSSSQIRKAITTLCTLFCPYTIFHIASFCAFCMLCLLSLITSFSQTWKVGQVKQQLRFFYYASFRFCFIRVKRAYDKCARFVHLMNCLTAWLPTCLFVQDIACVCACVCLCLCITCEILLLSLLILKYTLSLSLMLANWLMSTLSYYFILAFISSFCMCACVCECVFMAF